MEPMKPMQPMAPMEPMKWKDMPRWWPQDLGEPDSAGSQNDVDYAYFGDARRLLLRRGEHLTTYDTGDHRIHGVSQVSDAAHATFTSDRGEVRLEDLNEV